SLGKPDRATFLSTAVHPFARVLRARVDHPGTAHRADWPGGRSDDGPRHGSRAGVACIKLEPGGKQGSMTTHRRIITSVGLLMVAAACTPAAAHGNPLLSGYGGPGQGNQAILGATLLNGPGGGGSSGTVAAATSSGHVSGEGTSTTGAAPHGSQAAGAPKASGGAPRAAQRVHRQSAAA